MSEKKTNNLKDKKILLVDDDPNLLRLITIRLRSKGFDVTVAECAEEAVSLLPTNLPHLVITDLRMKEMDGLALFSHINEFYPTIPVIILTAHGTIKEAVAATNDGVFGFLTKPYDAKELIELTTKALTLNANQHLPLDDKKENSWRNNIITRSVPMENLLREVERVASSKISVYIHGESGTGKELIAQAIHKTSPRRDKEFVTVNCSAIPEELLESELFGHSKGSFSGATANRQGLFELADGGSLFLDEIGDMSAAFQVKLLRALQEGEIRPVGSNKSIKVDVRIISASHRDLQKLSDEGVFRMDLYYRLNVVTLSLPNLADRMEDIPLLANHFIATYQSQHNSVAKGLVAEAMELLIAYKWPGNIRQLRNVIEHVCTFATTPLIPVSLVEKALREKQTSLLSFNDAKNNFERDYLVKLLQLTNGSALKASKLAKRNRTEFYKLLDRHGLKAAQFKIKKTDQETGNK